MYFSNYLSPYINTITVLLFVIPFGLLCIKRKTFKPFTILKLTRTFNRTLIYYGILSVILLATMKIIDVTVYGKADGGGNDITETIIGAAYSYVVIGAFFYLPSVGLLNIINFAIQKFTKHKINQ
jgi:hypothetical protein